MSLRERLDSDLKASMKAGEVLRVSVIRLARSEIRYAEIAKGSPLTEDEIVLVVAKESKRRREAIEQYEKAGRTDLADKEMAELHILAQYMPEQLSENEVGRVAQEVISELRVTSKADRGKVMSATMQRVRGKADGRLVSEVVNRLLESISP